MKPKELELDALIALWGKLSGRQQHEVIRIAGGKVRKLTFSRRRIRKLTNACYEVIGAEVINDRLAEMERLKKATWE